MNRHHQSAGPRTVRVASYNIRKCIGTDRRRNPHRVLHVLNELNADIVVLQEADRRFGSRQSAIPHNLLESNTDYVAIPLDVQHDSMGWHGNAILVHREIPILDHDIVHIPHLEPRGVVHARLQVAGQPLALYGMHLDLSGLWRVRQARAITELARESMRHDPTLLMGDLNEWRSRGGCYREFRRYFNLLDCGRSYHSSRPVAKLDRIMHCDNMAPIECGVHRSDTATKASDHLPVWAEFGFI